MTESEGIIRILVFDLHSVDNTQALAVYDQTLIATDGSHHDELAVKQGLALAEALASQVIVVTVTQPYIQHRWSP